MVAGLEEVDRRQTALLEDGLHVGLRVAGQEEAPALERPEEDERRIVHLATVVGRRGRDAPGVGPEHVDRDAVQLESVTRSQSRRGRAARRQQRRQCLVAGAGTRHPRLDDLPDAVALEDEREPGHVILVGMGEDDEVDPAVPGRDAGIEGDDEAVGVGAAVDEHAAAARAGHEDGIALADVEDGDVDAAVGAGRGRDEKDRHGEGPDEPREAKRSPRAARPARRRDLGSVRSPGLGRAGRRAPACDGCARTGRTRCQAAGASRHPAGRAPPLRDGDEGKGEERRGSAGHLGRQLDTRQRQLGGEADDPDDGPEDDRGRNADDGGDRRRRPERFGGAPGERERASGHRRGHERHHREVRQRRERGEPPEGEEDDRERRRLGRH